MNKGLKKLIYIIVVLITLGNSTSCFGAKKARSTKHKSKATVIKTVKKTSKRKGGTLSVGYSVPIAQGVTTRLGFSFGL